MKAFVLSHMAKHKVPRYVEFVESFPMNAAGKILKYKMREEAVERLGLKREARRCPPTEGGWAAGGKNAQVPR